METSVYPLFGVVVLVEVDELVMVVLFVLVVEVVVVEVAL